MNAGSHARAQPGGDVRVRYWASIRAAAGVAGEQVSAGPLTSVLAQLRARHGDSYRFGQLLSICSVLVDEQPAGMREHDDVQVPPGSTVDLLPPFAGGASGVRRGTSAS